VIASNQNTTEIGSLLAVARAEARKREQSKINPPVRALVFVAELGLYVAVYEVLVDEKSVTGNSVVGKADDVKVDCGKSRREVS
jgi:hypothetical protein